MADEETLKQEAELLAKAIEAGRTDGDGPADVAELVKVEVDEDGE